jgi:hypothetical protein
MNEFVVRGVDVSALSVCRRCGVLRGDVVLSKGIGVTQRCRCDGWRRDEPWERCDFNCVAELCWCCASAVIPSGSRWSSYFCDECRPRIVALNRGVGRCVIPIGRHSIMNGVALRANPPPTDEALGRFVHDVGTIFERAARVARWRRRRVQRVLGTIDGDDAAALVSYIAAAPSVLGDSARAYDDLLEWWATV